MTSILHLLLETTPLPLDEPTLDSYAGSPESGQDQQSLALEGSEMALGPRFPHRVCRTAQATLHLVQGVEITTTSSPRSQIQKPVPRELGPQIRPRKRIAP